MKEPEMRQIARWMTDVLSRPTDDDLLNRVRGSVRELCEQFPVPGEVAEV
jgi:glycine hydroxymethyltransferase